MGYVIRSGRGKAKESDAIKTDEDARALMEALHRAEGDVIEVSLSTGTYEVNTTNPDTDSKKIAEAG